MQITNTRKQIFFPYKYVENSLEINIKEFIIDGIISTDFVDKNSRKINIQNKDFTYVNFKIEVNVEIEVLRSVFPDTEKNDLPCEVYLILHCDETKYRKAYKLIQDSNNFWKGNIELYKKDFKNKIEFFSLIIRNTDRNEKDDQFASYYGEKLLSSHEWIIQIDEPSKFPGNFLDIEWEDFKNSTHPILSKNPELLFYLEFLDNPKLILNESIDNLKPILSNESKTGTIATIRDVIFDSIALQVWVTLILSASQSVEKFEDLNSWQLSVMKQFAPIIYKDSDEQTAIEELIKDSHPNDEIDTFLSRITTAIQNKLKIDKNIKNLLNLSLRESNVV